MRRRSAWGLFDGKKSLGGLLRGKSVSGRKESVVGGNGLGERRRSAVERKRSEAVVPIAESGGEAAGASDGTVVSRGVDVAAAAANNGTAVGNGNGSTTTTPLPPSLSFNKTPKPPLGKKSQSEGNGIGKAGKVGLLRGMSIRNGKAKINGNPAKMETEQREEKDVSPVVKAKRRRSWAFWRDDGGGGS